VSGRGSVVSGWHYQPLPNERRAERDVLLRMILRAARALAENRMVRCTDFAFEQRAEVRTPIEGRPGLYHSAEAHTLAPEEAWLDGHGEGTYRLELCVQVQQAERGLLEAVQVKAAEERIGGELVAAEEGEQRKRRVRRRRDIVPRADLARVFALLRRRDATAGAEE
jgi:hypothetical protein